MLTVKWSTRTLRAGDFDEKGKLFEWQGSVCMSLGDSGNDLQYIVIADPDDEYNVGTISSMHRDTTGLVPLAGVLTVTPWGDPSRDPQN